MLRINLPGAKNVLYVNDKSRYRSIEKEIANAFFPYTQQVSSGDMRNRLNHDIVIETDGSNIVLIKNDSDSKCFYAKFNSTHQTYRQIYSIIRDNLRLTDGICFLHGACALINGHACLFLAETGTGKSTLGVYFDVMHKRCLTDDLIIMDVDGGIVYPISRYAHIRQGGMEALTNNVADSFQLAYNDFLLRYEYPLSDERFCEKYKVEYIFILCRGCTCQGISEAYNPHANILENMFLPYQMTNNIVSSLNIAQKYKIYNAYYDDLHTLSNQIESLVQSKSH